LSGIEKSKSTPFESVLYAIGIRYVGKTVAEKLARYFKSIDKIAQASVEDLLKAPELVRRSRKAFISFFQNPENQKR
jgi:DNA ligase (NAD+)